MGVQCNIILTYYTERHHEIEKIIDHLGVPKDADTEINPIGDRGWGPADMQSQVICMKDWYEAECQAFIVFLSTIAWDSPDTVQVYYCPASDENHQSFRYVKLFN